MKLENNEADIKVEQAFSYSSLRKTVIKPTSNLWMLNENCKTSRFVGLLHMLCMFLFWLMIVETSH